METIWKIAKKPEEVAAFLAELTELTHRHGLRISGYDCCLSGVPSDDAAKVFLTLDNDLGENPTIFFEEP